MLSKNPYIQSRQPQGWRFCRFGAKRGSKTAPYNTPLSTETENPLKFKGFRANRQMFEIFKGWSEEDNRRSEEIRRKRITELAPLIKNGWLFVPEGTERILRWQYANEDLFNSVHIPGSVTEIEEGAFKKIPCLTEVVIEEGVRKIGKEAFEQCPSLMKVTLPNSLKEIGYGVFYECASLESVNIPKSIEKIGNFAFRKCPRLPRQTLPAEISKIDGQSFDLVPDIPAESKNYRSADGLLFCTKCGYDVLCGADVSLTEAVVPDSVGYVDNYAFAGCESLRSVTFHADIPEMFEGVFSHCTSLVSVTLPKKLMLIGQGFFLDCSSLQNLRFPEGFYSIGEWAFARCTALRTLELPETLKYIGNWAFLECSALESIDIPDSVRSLGYTVFENCTSLRSVTMSQKLYSRVMKKNLDLFKGCTSLKSITLRDATLECASVPVPGEGH